MMGSASLPWAGVRLNSSLGKALTIFFTQYAFCLLSLLQFLMMTLSPDTQQLSSSWTSLFWWEWIYRLYLLFQFWALTRTVTVLLIRPCFTTVPKSSCPEPERRTTPEMAGARMFHRLLMNYICGSTSSAGASIGYHMRYLRLSISSSGYSTSTSFFLCSFLMMERVMIGLPLRFSRSGELYAFCFRAFSSCSYSFFFFFSYRFSPIQRFSSSLTMPGASSLHSLKVSSWLSILFSISFSKSKADTFFCYAPAPMSLAVYLEIRIISDYRTAYRSEISSLLVVLLSYQISSSMTRICFCRSCLLANNSFFLLISVSFLRENLFLDYQISCSISFRFVMRKRLDYSREWKMLASCSGSLKYISYYYDYSESYSLSTEPFVLGLNDYRESIFYCRFLRSYSVSSGLRLSRKFLYFFRFCRVSFLLMFLPVRSACTSNFSLMMATFSFFFLVCVSAFLMASRASFLFSARQLLKFSISSSSICSALSSPFLCSLVSSSNQLIFSRLWSMSIWKSRVSLFLLTKSCMGSLTFTLFFMAFLAASMKLALD